jgi:hypothetical protein
MAKVPLMIVISYIKDGWQSLVYCTGLENRRPEMVRGSKSHFILLILACAAEAGESHLTVNQIPEG